MLTIKLSQLALLSTSLLLAALCGLPPTYGEGNTFNVKTYGAVGNGSHDDTTAIQSAINAAEQKPGSTVEFPPGIYLYSAALHMSGVKLVNVDDIQDVALVSDNTSAELDVSGTGSEIHGLIFSTPNKFGGTAIRVKSGARKFVLDHNSFGGFERAIVVENASGGTISRNAIGIHLTPGFISAVGIRLEQGSSDIQLNTNAFQGNELTALTFTHGLEVDSCSRISISKNECVRLSDAMVITNSLQVTAHANKITDVHIGVSGIHNNLETVDSNTIESADIGIADLSGTDQTIQNSK